MKYLISILLLLSLNLQANSMIKIKDCILTESYFSSSNIKESVDIDLKNINKVKTTFNTKNKQYSIYLYVTSTNKPIHKLTLPLDRVDSIKPKIITCMKRI